MPKYSESRQVSPVFGGGILTIFGSLQRQEINKLYSASIILRANSLWPLGQEVDIIILFPLYRPITLLIIE